MCGICVLLETKEIYQPLNVEINGILEFNS